MVSLNIIIETISILVNKSPILRYTIKSGKTLTDLLRIIFLASWVTVFRSFFDQLSKGGCFFPRP